MCHGFAVFGFPFVSLSLKVLIKFQLQLVQRIYAKICQMNLIVVHIDEIQPLDFMKLKFETINFLKNMSLCKKISIGHKI
jgi:hypothetical protein